MPSVVISSQADIDAMFPSAAVHKQRTKELEVFIALLNNPFFVMSKVNILANPDDGVDFAKFIKQNRDDVFLWITQTEHKMLDKGGQWCCGCMGSRWADITVGGKLVRIAFYSRKRDNKFYSSITSLQADYSLMICQLD